MKIPLREYKEDLYYSFYDTHGENPKYYAEHKKFIESRLGGDRRIEERQPRIREALIIYNGFFTKFYQKYGGEIIEEVLVEEFIKFMGKISTEKITLSVVHDKKEEMPRYLGALCPKGSKGKDSHIYKIEIMDFIHKRDFNKIVTLSHELVHLVQHELESINRNPHLFNI